MLPIVLLSLVCLTQGRDNILYFPDNMPDKSQLVPSQSSVAFEPSLIDKSAPLNTTDLESIRGTAQYEKIVNNIIASGTFRTALSINRALLDSPNNQDRNIVFAPVSISAALALILLGSNGKTFEEVANVMGLITGVLDIKQKSETVHEEFGRMLRKIEGDSGFQLGKQATFASAIFVQANYPIRSVFKQTAESLYRSEVLNLDFQRSPAHATEIINAWVSDRTSGKIKNIISQVAPNTKVVLVSAMHFKAEWEHHFYRGVTKERPFFVNGRSSPTNVRVPLMANGGIFPYYKDLTLGCEIMGFPYKGGKTTMYVVMPFNSSANVIKNFERRVTEEDLNRLADQTEPKGVTVLFPKMKLESTINLRDALQKLGMHSLFNPHDANFALLSPGLNAVPSHRDGSTQPANAVVQNPIEVTSNLEEVLIFSRSGIPKNCTASVCQGGGDIEVQPRIHQQKLGPKVIERVETLDAIRNQINQQSEDNNYQNPGLYADQVIHKVFLDITEKGTEGAAATGVSLARDGSKIGFRVDVPFLFFIRHEETKMVFFWGSVIKPTPSQTDL